MKLLTGITIALLIITGAILTILALWGVQPISWTIVWKSGVTIMIAGITSIIISIIYYFFIKRNSSDRKNKG